MDLTRISMYFHRSGMGFNDSGAWVPETLWRPVAPCGGLWRKAVAPIQYHAERKGLAGWWLAGWLDGCMEVVGGLMEVGGITAVT